MYRRLNAIWTRGFVALLVFGLGLALAACGISTKKYNAKIEEIKQLRMNADSSKRAEAEAKGQLDDLKAQLKDARAKLKVKAERLTNVLFKMEGWKKKKADLLAQIDRLKNPPKPVASVDMEEGEIKGGLSGDAVRDKVKEVAGKIKDCYAKRVAKKPRLKGRFIVKFQIDRKGKTKKVKVKGKSFRDRKTLKCVRNVIKKLRFAKPAKRKKVKVSLPMVFKYDVPG